MASKAKVRKLDTVFSKFIRLRDSKDGYFICCSCGRYLPYEQADAGHFINRRFMATRWREDNVHAQCRSCNRFKEGDAAGYALFMIRRYGEAKIELLHAMKNETAKFTDSEVDLLIDDYKKKAKDLTEERKRATMA